MRNNSFLKYLILQILTLPVVILIFRSMGDKKIASMFASSVFISLSLGLLINEYRQRKFQARSFWAAGIVFFLCFALPIFLLRITHWDQEFSQVRVGPLAASSLHASANISFILWILTSAYWAWSMTRKQLEK